VELKGWEGEARPELTDMIQWDSFVGYCKIFSKLRRFTIESD